MMLNIDDFNQLVTKLVAKECDWNTYSGKFFLCAFGGGIKLVNLKTLHIRLKVYKYQHTA